MIYAHFCIYMHLNEAILNLNAVIAMATGIFYR